MIKKLWSFLDKLQCNVDKGGSIITRCPFCGDSKRKLVNYGHLYISKSIPFFICFRCNTKGHIKKLLLKLINDKVCTPDQATAILNAYGGSTKIRVTYNSTKLHYEIGESKLTKQMYDYLIARIGKELQWSKHKIFTAKDLFENSNIYNFNHPIINRMKNDMAFRTFIYESFIAFLSYFEYNIVMRNVLNQEPRYIHVSLTHTDPKSKLDFYTPQCYFKPYDIYSKFSSFVVAEGVFDILNQRVPFNNIDNNKFKIAVFGKSRLHKALDIAYSFFITNPTFIIYLDKDVYQSKVTLQALKFTYRGKAKFYINKIGKDMGESSVVLCEV